MSPDTRRKWHNKGWHPHMGGRLLGIRSLTSCETWWEWPTSYETTNGHHACYTAATVVAIDTAATGQLRRRTGGFVLRWLGTLVHNCPSRHWKGNAVPINTHNLWYKVSSCMSWGMKFYCMCEGKRLFFYWDMKGRGATRQVEPEPINWRSSASRIVLFCIFRCYWSEVYMYSCQRQT